MMHPKIHVGGELKQAWGLFTSRLLAIIGLMLLTALVYGVPIVGIIVVGAIVGDIVGALLIILGIIALFPSFFLISNTWTHIGFTIVDAKPLSPASIFAGFGTLLNYTAVLVLYAVVVMAGTVIFIVPGIIFSVMFIFAPYYVVDRKLGPIEAMKESMRTTSGYKWDVYSSMLLMKQFIKVSYVGLLPAYLAVVTLSTFANQGFAGSGGGAGMAILGVIVGIGLVVGGILLSVIGILVTLYYSRISRTLAK